MSTTSPPTKVTPRLLLVEDDYRLRTLLERFLTDHDFAVTGVASLKTLTQTLERQVVDLIVLDLSLPDGDGLDWCRRLRSQGDATPVVILTAKGDDVDRIVGLEIGADDYLPKPCNPRELESRIRAVLRRHTPAVPGAPSKAPQVVTFGPWSLDLATRQLCFEGSPRSITTGEFAVLSVLVTHPHQPLSRDKLMTLARGREHGAFDRSIDVQISRLRRLLEAESGQPRYIQTVWGVGYVFVPDVASEDGAPQPSKP
ncbi:MAG: two-component system response regulator OmpR [Candidatus Competibacterales bacterium]